MRTARKFGAIKRKAGRFAPAAADAKDVRFEDRIMRFPLLAPIAVAVLFAASFFVGSDAQDAQADKSGDPPPPPAFPGNLKDSQTPEKPDFFKGEEKKTKAGSGNPDEEILHRTELPTDGKALLKFFQKRILPESDRPALERLIRQLGSAEYRTRTAPPRNWPPAVSRPWKCFAPPMRCPTTWRWPAKSSAPFSRFTQKDVAPEPCAAAQCACWRCASRRALSKRCWAIFLSSIRMPRSTKFVPR